jgi:hypothetical protein
MTLSIQLVPLSLVHQTWPKVERFIKDSLEWSSDDYTIDQVRLYVSKGEWMLVVAVDEQQVIQGAMTINLYNAANARVAFITTTGGRLIINDETFAQLCALVKEFGATKIRGVGRDSMIRMLERVGLKKRYTLFEAEI